jgi:hypothetical protein
MKESWERRPMMEDVNIKKCLEEVNLKSKDVGCKSKLGVAWIVWRVLRLGLH